MSEIQTLRHALNVADWRYQTIPVGNFAAEQYWFYRSWHRLQLADARYLNQLAMADSDPISQNTIICEHATAMGLPTVSSLQALRRRRRSQSPRA